MSKIASLEGQQLKMDFSIDLSVFCQNIKSNFALIWQNLTKQAEQIQGLKQNIQQQSIQQNRQIKSRINSRNSNRKQSKNLSFNFSQVSVSQNQMISPETKINPENNFSSEMNKNRSQSVILSPEKNSNAKQQKQNAVGKLPEQKMKLKDETQRRQQIQTHVQQAANNQEGEVKNQNQVLPNQGNIHQNQENAQNNQNKTSSLIENKILQLNQRLQKLELASIKESGTVSKKMNQIYNQLQKNFESLNKKDGELKRQQLLIQKLRGQLSQYKLKKQSQLMRMANNGNNNSSNSNKQYNQYLLDKIQEISNCLPQLLLKSDFNDFKMELKPTLNRIEKKANQAVSSQQFNGLIGILSRKRGNDNIATGKINKQPQAKQNPKLQNIQTDDIEPLLQLRIISLQKQLKQHKQLLDEFQTMNNTRSQKAFTQLSDLSAKIESLTNQNSNFVNKNKQHQQFMRNMNQSYNQKFKEVISQIADTQESVEKLSNQMKFYSYTKSDSNVGTVGPTAHTSGGIESTKVIDLENQMGQIKKKVNKIALKMQGLKEELLGTRQDFTRDLDTVKAMLEKKCDWESLKKGLNYFEQRIKQVANYIESIQRSMMEPQQNGQSTAAKRGWTCLCCDKDIKQYEGKLGQAKFTSIFPSRYESPRIGGYFKQKQANKQYNQIFLKHNRRLSQSNTKSKEQIN